MTTSGTATVAAVRRATPWLVLAAVLGAVLGGGWAYLRTPGYTASATVVLTPLAGTPFNAVGGRLDAMMATEAANASSAQVVRAAAAGLGGRMSAGTLSRRLSVDVPSSTMEVTVSVSAGQAALARDAAQAVAEQFLAQRSLAAQQDAARRSAALTKDSDRIQGLIADVVRAQQATKDDALTVALRLRRDAYVSALESDEAAQTGIQQQSTVPGQVIDPAGLPARQTWLAVGVAALVGLLVGLLVAVGVVVLGSLLDARVRTADDLPEEVVLGTVPAGDLTDGEPVCALAVGSAPEEVYRRLRLALLAAGGSRAGVTVTGPATDQHARAVSQVAANLALVLAAADVPTVLLDAADGAAAALLGISAGAGLGAVGAGRPVRELLQTSPLGPDVLTCAQDGSDGPSSAAVLDGPALSAVLAELRNRYQHVVVCAPAATSSVTGTLAAGSELTVLALPTDRVRRAQVGRARYGLQLLGARVLGTVLVDRRRSDLTRDGAAPARRRLAFLPGSR